MTAHIDSLRRAADNARQILAAAEAELAEAVRMAPVDAAIEAGDDDLVDELLEQAARDAADFAELPDHAYDVIRYNEHGEPIGWC